MALCLVPEAWELRAPGISCACLGPGGGRIWRGRDALGLTLGNLTASGPSAPFNPELPPESLQKSDPVFSCDGLVGAMAQGWRCGQGEQALILLPDSLICQLKSRSDWETAFQGKSCQNGLGC